MTNSSTHDNSAIDALPSVAQIVSSLDMRARKSLGQNFLFDLNLTRRIARNAAAQLTGTTIEVGPGPGGLTRALLLEGADRVVAVEKDFRAAKVLESLLHAAQGRLELIEGDAMKTPLWEIGTMPRRIVANLPYNIATTLLIQWLEHASAFETMTLMFQREVAERITAQPGDSAYGRLSILTGWIADSTILFDIPPDVRGQFDYVVATADNQHSNKKKLWAQFGGVFQSYREFDAVFTSCTNQDGGYSWRGKSTGPFLNRIRRFRCRGLVLVRLNIVLNVVKP